MQIKLLRKIKDMLKTTTQFV